MSAEEQIRHYLAEGIVALLPVYRAGVEGTAVFTLLQTYQAYHSLSWTLKLLARFCCLDLAALRRRSSRQLGVRHHIPLPLAAGLVLLPVKVREGEKLGETSVGYVNLLQIEETAESGPAGAGCSAAQTPTSTEREGGDQATGRSRINCRGSIVIHSLNTLATLRLKLQQGETIRKELMSRQQLLALQAQPSSAPGTSALPQLPPTCGCPLHSLLHQLLEKPSRPNT